MISDRIKHVYIITTVARVCRVVMKSQCLVSLGYITIEQTHLEQINKHLKRTPQQQICNQHFFSCTSSRCHVPSSCYVDQSRRQVGSVWQNTRAGIIIQDCLQYFMVGLWKYFLWIQTALVDTLVDCLSFSTRDPFECHLFPGLHLYIWLPSSAIIPYLCAQQLRVWLSGFNEPVTPQTRWPCTDSGYSDPSFYSLQ